MVKVETVNGNAKVEVAGSDWDILMETVMLINTVRKLYKRDGVDREEYWKLLSEMYMIIEESDNKGMVTTIDLKGDNNGN